MKIFDGTNLYSVIKSLSKAFNLHSSQLIKEVKRYSFLNIPNLINGNLSLQGFFDHCEEDDIPIKTSNLQFDRVTFFHITSHIDNGAFLQEKGLLDLDELLLNPSPLSQYLKKKDVRFFIKDKSPFVSINGKVQQLKDLPCNKAEWVKPRITARLTKFKSMDLEGITGFLFLDCLENDNIYRRIRNVPEFLYDLDDCIGGIADEWKNISKPVILKCEVDIETWHQPKDIYKKENKHEKSYGIAREGFLYLAEVCAEKLGINRMFRSGNYYPFIAHGIGIPPARVTVI